MGNLRNLLADGIDRAAHFFGARHLLGHGPANLANDPIDRIHGRGDFFSCLGLLGDGFRRLSCPAPHAGQGLRDFTSSRRLFRGSLPHLFGRVFDCLPGFDDITGGAALVIDASAPDFDAALDRALRRLLTDTDLRLDLAARSAEICDGQGASRVAEAFMVLIAARGG